MSEPQPIPAKGATAYDLLGLKKDEFERMTGMLIVDQVPGAVSTGANKDGGADVVLPTEDGQGYDQAWQAKHFPNAISWTECKKSFAAAKTKWAPARYTFIFPRGLTAREQRTFDKHFRSADETVAVDYINGDGVQAMLIGSDQGQRIARMFFADTELDRERTYQAIEAGGRLDTPADAVDRLGNIGQALAGMDAFFQYPAATHEADGPGPPMAPGAVMSIEKGDGTIVSRVDVVPRTDDAMEQYAPTFEISATGDETGRRAAERLHEALREGKAIELDEGLDFTFTRLPPGLEHMVGQRMTGGVIKLGPGQRVRLPAPPWEARLTISPTGGDPPLPIDVSLMQTDTVPEDWDDDFAGVFGGMHVSTRVRWTEGSGAIRWNFRYARDDSPLADQLRALAFLRALDRGGEVAVSDRASGRPNLTVAVQPGTVPGEVETLHAFLDDLVTIEEWAKFTFSLPDDVTGQEVHDVASVAATIRNGGNAITWNGAELVVDKTALEALDSGAPVTIEHNVDAVLLGQTVRLGRTRLAITDYVVAAELPDPAQPGHVRLRIEPPTEAAAAGFQQLIATKPRARRPPPPPPRKGKRRHGKRRASRGRRR